MQDHVTGMILDGYIGMAGNIHEKVIDVEYSVGGWLSLHWTEYTDGDI